MQTTCRACVPGESGKMILRYTNRKWSRETAYLKQKDCDSSGRTGEMILTGTITAILTQMEDDWGRYEVSNPAGKLTAVGVIPDASLGMEVTLVGEEKDDKYGHQYQISGVLSSSMRDDNGAFAFLSSGLVKGIGPKKARSIVDKFGRKSVDLFDTETGREKLCRTKGITPKILAKAMPSYKENKKYKDIFLALNGTGTVNQVKIIYNKYGNKAVSILKTNPYQVADEVRGLGFKKIDAMAMHIGIKADSEFRIMSAAKYVIEQDEAGNGNCYMHPENLKTQVISLLTPVPKFEDLGDKAAENALNNWDVETEEKLIKKYNPSPETIDILKQTAETRRLIAQGYSNAILHALEKGTLINDDGKIYTRNMYRMEGDVAARIGAMLKEKSVRFISKEIIEDVIQKTEHEKAEKAVEKESGSAIFSITEEQRKAVYLGLMHRISIISGGPGRGKTTITEIIAKAFHEAGRKKSFVSFGREEEDVIMLAPTGRAAQRITESTGIPAMTAHRAVLSALRLTRGKSEEIDLDDADTLSGITGERPKNKLIICDETSMVDISLMQKILWYAEYCNIIFIGDADQIASVGPGCVLRDMIHSDVVPYILLKEGHRNSGAIARNAEMINAGLPISSYTYDEQFKYFPASADTICDMVVNDYIRMRNQYGYKDVLLCTAMRSRGPVCVDVLNKKLQEIYTKGQPCMRVNGKLFRVGDRVMNIKNDYFFTVKRVRRVWHDKDGTVHYEREPQDGVFNGERGKIYNIADRVDPDTGEAEKCLCVKFDDGSIAGYDAEDAKKLTLAYATTVHKCQGSEAKCVMMAYTYSDYLLLYRSLFYTGETRAQKEFRFYGEEKLRYGRYYSAFDIAVSRTNDRKRLTSLSDRLRANAAEIKAS